MLGRAVLVEELFPGSGSDQPFTVQQPSPVVIVQSHEPEYKTVYITLSAEELKSFGSQTGDTEGFVNYGLSIKGIKLSVMIHERKDSVKLSLRSLGDFSVNEMARKHFEGGGHRNASGGSSPLSLDQTLQKFLTILPEYKSQLNND